MWGQRLIHLIPVSKRRHGVQGMQRCMKHTLITYVLHIKQHILPVWLWKGNLILNTSDCRLCRRHSQIALILSSGFDIFERRRTPNWGTTRLAAMYALTKYLYQHQKLGTERFLPEASFGLRVLLPASVCVCVCLYVFLPVCQSLACPRDNSGPTQARIIKFGP